MITDGFWQGLKIGVAALILICTSLVIAADPFVDQVQKRPAIHIGSWSDVVNICKGDSSLTLVIRLKPESVATAPGQAESGRVTMTCE